MMSLFNKKKRKEKRFDDKLLWYKRNKTIWNVLLIGIGISPGVIFL